MYDMTNEAPPAAAAAAAPLHSNQHLPYDHNRPDDWSRYADDPSDDNTRHLHEPSRRMERKRQFEMLDIEEQQQQQQPHPPNNNTSSPAAAAAVLFRACLRVAATRVWDKVYLASLGVFFGVAPRAVLWPPLVVASLSTVPPIAGALAFRMLAFRSLRKRRDHRKAWGLFFVLALKALPPTRATRVAPRREDVVVQNGDHLRFGGAVMAAAKLRSSLQRKRLRRQNLAEENKPPRRRRSSFSFLLLRKNRRRTSRRSKVVVAAVNAWKDHHHGGVRMLEWKCVACGRNQKQPLSSRDSVETVVHQLRSNNRVCASFKIDPYRPRCACCGTPIDYRVRPSNKRYFHAPTGDAARAVAILNEQRVAALERVSRERRERRLQKQREKQRRLMMMDPPHHHHHHHHEEKKEEEPTTTEAFVREMFEKKARDDETFVRRLRNAARLIKSKFRHPRMMMTSSSSSKKLLYFDWTFASSAKKFRPEPARPALRPGEGYEPGDEVESYAHYPTWYPAIVLRRNSNGSYALRFDSGEVADAVGPKFIRYRIVRPILPVQRVACAACLALLVAWPGWVAAYLADASFFFQDASAGVVAVPLAVFAAAFAVVLAIQFATLSGYQSACLLFKLWGFWSAPPLLLFLFALVWATGSDVLVAFLCFLGFWASATLVAATVKPVFSKIFLAAFGPIAVCGTLLVLWHRREILPLYVVFAPGYVVYAQAWWLHLNLPHVWDATFDAWRPSQDPPSSSSRRRRMSSFFGGRGARFLSARRGGGSSSSWTPASSSGTKLPLDHVGLDDDDDDDDLEAAAAAAAA